MRVGDRIRRTNLSAEIKYLVIFLRKGHITDLLIPTSTKRQVTKAAVWLQIDKHQMGTGSYGQQF
jgi:hypothetical protein